MKPTPEWGKAALLKSPLFEPLHTVLAGFDVAGFPRCGKHGGCRSSRAALLTARRGIPTRSDNWHDLLNAFGVSNIYEKSVWITMSLSS